MKLAFPLLLFVVAWSVPCDAEQALPFDILSVEQQKKGASLSPVHPPRYVLLVARAALTRSHPDLTEANIEETLRGVLSAVRLNAAKKGIQCDGVSAYLYESPDHWNSRSRPLGEADWWPKGHSLSFQNDANVRNKATYEETVKVIALPKASSSVVSRLSLEERKAIFTAAVRAEMRAEQEAEAKYPSSVPLNKLRTWDARAAMEKRATERERLKVKYEAALFKECKISKSELQTIAIEGAIQNWQIPKH